MRMARATMGLILTLGCVYLHADEGEPQKITLVGTLHRAMAIGGRINWLDRAGRFRNHGGRETHQLD